MLNQQSLDAVEAFILDGCIEKPRLERKKVYRGPQHGNSSLSCSYKLNDIQAERLRLQTVCNIMERLHWLQPNRASTLPAESALAQDQHESTKAILLTKSAMLYVTLRASSLTAPSR